MELNHYIPSDLSKASDDELLVALGNKMVEVIKERSIYGGDHEGTRKAAKEAEEIRQEIHYRTRQRAVSRTQENQ